MYSITIPSFLTTDDIAFHVFEVIDFYPITVSMNASLVGLNLPPSVILVSTTINYTLPVLSLIHNSPRPYLNYYHCPASTVAIIPITSGVCEVVFFRQALELTHVNPVS